MLGVFYCYVVLGGFGTGFISAVKVGTWTDDPAQAFLLTSCN